MSQANSRISRVNVSSPKLSLTVQYASRAQHLPTRAQLRRWISAAQQRDVSITLRIVDESDGRELNKNYRGKDYATNVLTFVYDDTQPLSGDIVICAPVVEREAAAQHKGLLAHYAHLAIHAALHLQGYQHDDETGAAEMESLETALMLKLHYPDPYQATWH
jgi:probable rRNA maturation factor